MPGEQLKQLAAKVPDKLVSQVDKGFGNVDYLDHAQVVQLLLHHLEAPFNWEVSAPHSSGDAKNPVAVIGTLTVVVDGKQYTVQGVGDGQDFKKAESDAVKRAAMKLGLGLELWAQDSYWLDRATGWQVSDDTVQ